VTVYGSLNAQIKPGRTEDAIALVKEGVPIMTKAGARSVRLLLGTSAGEAFQSLVMNSDFDSVSAYGRFLDKLGADAAAQSYVARFSDPDSPVVPTATFVTADVPSDHPSRPDRGSVVEVHYMKARPGGLDRLIAMATHHRSLIEKHGAINTHVITALHGGSQSGLIMAVAEFPDNESWGNTTEMTSAFFAADSPADVVFSGIFADVPLG
jgi:hypothetical protein